MYRDRHRYHDYRGSTLVHARGSFVSRSVCLQAPLRLSTFMATFFSPSPSLNNVFFSGPQLYRTVEKMWGAGGAAGGGGGLPGGLPIMGGDNLPTSTSATSHDSQDKKFSPTPPPTSTPGSGAATSAAPHTPPPAPPTPMDATSHLPAMLSQLSQLSNAALNSHRDSATPTPTSNNTPTSQAPPPSSSSPSPLDGPSQDVQKMVSTSRVNEGGMIYL